MDNIKTEAQLDNDIITITVRTLAGKIIPIQANKTDNTHSLKEKLVISEGIPIDQIRLVYSGHEMENEKNLLDDYGIDKDTTIHLIYRLRGKPVILLYNYCEGEKIEVKVTLNQHDTLFSTIYPKPKNFHYRDTVVKWDVNFIENGKLHFVDNNKLYP